MYVHMYCSSSRLVCIRWNVLVGMLIGTCVVPHLLYLWVVCQSPFSLPPFTPPSTSSPSTSPSLPLAVQEAMNAVNRAIESSSKTELLRGLQSEEARFTNLRPENTQWYMNILSKAVKDKAEHEVCCGRLVATHVSTKRLKLLNILSKTYNLQQLHLCTQCTM